MSEITWITNSRPSEIEDFWAEGYPEIDIASNKIKILENNGYTLVGYFYLTQNSWIENKFEIELYKKYKDYYSYGFYIARKN